MALIDAGRLVPERPIQPDLCIVGAGAAGITLAREFIGTRYRVALVESGGLTYSGRVQQLYAGESVGLPSYALTYSRFRIFGGSTSRWAAQCRPLDPIDFEPRPGIAHSGWPFDHHHLQAWYRRAQAVCGLDMGEELAWTPGPGRLPLCDGGLEAIVFRFGYPRDFGQAYRQELERSANVDVFLNASVVEIQPAPDLRSVQTLRAKTLGGGAFEIQAQVYVLACGGVENARLLLAFNRIAPAGIANGHDLVGRFFMDIPISRPGTSRRRRPNMRTART
jgi:choline dehydrogenase-like flavoprotein